ncbi:MAG: hypothetical protein ACRDGI_05505 [Candidatus Limnocylindrales bacterium]
MSQTFQPDDPNRFRPPAASGFVRGWSWSQDPRPGLPWIGLVLVLFGGLLLVGEFVPGFHVAGPALGVAAGLAFLVAWISNRGRWGLYPGIFVLAISLPGFLIDLSVLRDAPGWTTLFLGIGLVIVALARYAGHGGLGWQAILGGLLVLGGGDDVARTLAPNVPSFDAILFPALILAVGVLILVRSARPRQP